MMSYAQPAAADLSTAIFIGMVSKSNGLPLSVKTGLTGHHLFYDQALQNPVQNLFRVKNRSAASGLQSQRALYSLNPASVCVSDSRR
jgi:hypothetical protein